MTFSDLLPWFGEPGFVAVSLVCFAAAFAVGAKANTVWQVITCIFFGSFLITRWSEGEVWSMALWWVYVGWCGFLFQKVGGGGFFEGLSHRISRCFKNLAEGGPPRRPAPQNPNPDHVEKSARREQQFRAQQEAYKQRQSEREAAENRHRQTTPEPEPRERTNTPPPDMPAPTPVMRPWWEVLEVSRNADATAIKKAYREKVKKYHPDMVSHLGVEFQKIAEQKSKEINTAYSEASQ